MYGPRRPARINVNALVIFLLVTVLLGTGAVVGHYIRKRMMANEALGLGKAAFESRNWVDASRYLRRYLQKYPDDVPILEKYAKASLSIRPRDANSVGSAISAYRRLLRFRPGDAEICRQLATLYFGGKDYVEAAYVCRERLKVDDTDADAMTWLGRSLIAQMKYTDAREVLEHLIELHPDQVKAYALIGSVEVKESAAAGVERAEDWMTRAVTANPKSAEAYAQRARFYRVLGKNWDAAKADLASAGKLLGDDPRVQLTLASEWIEWDGFDKARKYLDMVENAGADVLTRLDIDPDVLSSALFTARSDLLLRDKQASGQAELASQALKVLVGGFRTKFLPIATRLFLAGGDIDNAQHTLQEYEEALSKRSGEFQDDDELLVLRARLALAKNQPYEALNSLLGETGELPRSGDAMRLVAEVMRQTGQTGRAREILLKLVERSPQDRDAWIQLAEGYRGTDWERAYSAAGTAFNLRPTLGARLLFLEARMMRELGKRDFDVVVGEIEDELASLREQFPKNAGIRVLIAAGYSASGRMSEAIAELEQALKECEGTDAAERLLVDLYMKKGETTPAVALAQANVQRHPESSSARLQLAELYEKQTLDGEVRSTYGKALEELKGASQLDVAHAYVNYLLRQKDTDTAVEVLRKMAGIHPKDVETLGTLLSIPSVRTDVAEAQRLVDRIRSIEGPNGVRWKLYQAGLWWEDHQWRKHERETRELLDDCILADPLWEEPALALGAIHQALGELREAEKVYRSTLAHKSDAFAVADQLVGLLKREGRYVEAQDVLDTMPQASPLLAAHAIDLAIGRGEYEDAIKGLEAYVATHPGDVPSRIRLARLSYVVKRDFDRAMTLLEEASKLSPDSVDVLFAKVSILQSQGKGKDALALLDQEVERLQNFGAYWLRATYYMAIGENDLAEKDFVHLTTFEDSAPAAYSLLGNFYFRTDRQAEAIATWEKGLKIDPDNTTLRRALTKGLLASKDPASRERGKLMLTDLRGSLSDDPELLYLEASTLFDERNRESRAQAIDRLERAVTLNPSYVTSHMALIRLAREDGDFAKARQLVNRALAANPTDLALKLAQITVELDVGNVGVARELARTLLVEKRDDLMLCNQISDAFRKANQLRDAHEYNGKALAIASEDPFANVTRAALLVADGKKNEAIEHLKKYVETPTGQKNVSALLALASQETDVSDFASADEILQRAGELEPNAVGVTVERLRWLGAQSRYDDVLDILAQTPGRSPQQLPVLMAAANLLSVTDRDQYLSKARDTFQRIRDLAPGNIPALFGYAETTFQLGDLDGAIDALRDVIKVDPNNRAGLNNLAWMLATKKGSSGLTEAEELIGRGLQRYPDDVHLLDTSGVIMFKLGRLSEAREQLERCLTLAKDAPTTRAQSLLHLAEVLIALKVEPSIIKSRLREVQEIQQARKVLSADEQRQLAKLLAAAGKL